ncbi:hypothetical protein ACFQL1_16315 [Halomicroarcula sp. GCM10025709]
MLPDISFELRLLLHINLQPYPQDHLRKAQDVAFDTASRTLQRDLLETNLKGEVDYINWNRTKINAWYRLMEGIGVLSFADSRELILSPRPVLLYKLLETFRDTENSTDFGAAIPWIEDHFMSALNTRPGTPRLHQGITDTLQVLIDEDLLSVRGMSDARHEIELPSTQSRQEEPTVTEFELHGWPNNPPASKRHLFDRFMEGAL